MACGLICNFFGAAPSALIYLVLTHALTGVAIDSWPFGPGKEVLKALAKQVRHLDKESSAVAA